MRVRHCLWLMVGMLDKFNFRFRENVLYWFHNLLIIRKDGRKMKRIQRVISFLLALLLVVGMVPPVEVRAEETVPVLETIGAETVAAAVETTAEAREETLPPETMAAPAVETEPAWIPETVEEEPAETLSGSEEAANAMMGVCGTNVSWSLSDGVLTISGTGGMNNYSTSSTAPWFSERLNIRSVVVESGVTAIGNCAFYYCVNLESITIADTVKSIGWSAFLQCSGLTSAVIPQGVTNLSDSLFSGCTSLVWVELPDSLKSLSYNVFSDCTSLAAIDLPAGVTEIGSRCFSGCTALTSMVLPEGIKSIQDSLFYGCTALESVSIPQMVTAISYNAFENCGKLKAVEIPAGVKSIGGSAFAGCVSLTEVTLPEGISAISGSLFRGCTGLTEIVIPQSVVSLGGNAFQGCEKLETVTLKDGLVTINGYAFNGCTGLKTIVIPDTVTELGYYAFAGCTGLNDISLPRRLETIGYNAFSGCSSLEGVEIPGTVTSLGSSAFYDCDALESITIPGSIAEIQYDTFRDCDGLRQVVIEEGVQVLGARVFRECDELTSVVIPSTVVAIVDETFGNCPSLTDITFGHLSSAELSLAYNTFWLNRNNNQPIVDTTVSVPYARDVHSAISGYDWEYYRRSVSYRSWVELPVSAIAIGVHPAEVEAGLEVVFTVQAEPWYHTSELSWEVRNDSGEAVINSDGVLVGIEPGYVTVICRSCDDDTIFDETQIKILKATAQVEAIDIRCDAENEAEVELGQKVQMIAGIFPGNAANKTVSWEVEEGSGKAVITEDGILTGIQCGTVTVYALATDGSGVVGSRVVEVLRYVSDITILINGLEETDRVGLEETAILTAVVSPENASYPQVTWTLTNGTGEASLSNGRLQGVAAGTVTITAQSQDSRKLTVSKEIEIAGEKAAYAASGGNLYYNTVTGTIIGCDDTVTSANIPVAIAGTRITGIAPRAFYNRDKLSSVTIPTPVTYIGDEAFYDCDNLTSLRFMGNGITTIGRNAFNSCGKLVNLALPESIVSIGEGAFYNLSSLKNLTVSGELDTSGWLSHNYNTPLDSVTFTGTKVIPQKVRWYDEYSYTMEDMPGRNARKVILRDTITEIEEFAFCSHNNLEELVMSPNVRAIGKGAFEGCTKLARVQLPESIETLGDYAFRRCRALEAINLPESLKSIGKGCFDVEGEGQTLLQLIDLSGNPSEMRGQELQLTYRLPEVLLKATGGKNEIYWYLMNTPEYPDPYEIAHVEGKEGILWAHGIGTVMVACRDEYTGAVGTWVVEISSGIVIQSPGDQNMIVSGETLQLQAVVMPDQEKAEVRWSIREQDQDYASITQNGKLAAKNVTQAHQIEVTAWPYNGADPVTMQLWIVPKTTGLYLREGDADITGSQLDVDMAMIATMQLTCVSMPEGAMGRVIWRSSDETVASVGDGLVIFNSPGTVTITAESVDGSGKKVSVVFHVTYRDACKTLTAELDVPDSVLEAGSTAQLLIYGADPQVPLDMASLQFSVPSSQSGIATVDETGLITAGETPGTVTITAALKGDPLNRRVTVKLSVIARQTQRLVLRTEAPAPAEVRMLDADGYPVLDPANASAYTVELKKADLNQSAYSFVILPEAFTSAGGHNPGRAGLKWATSNSKIAAVTVNPDGTATVTVKRDAIGSCVISAVTTDQAKIENQLTIHIRDYSPRLETQKPTLNTYLEQAVVLGLVPSYDNEIVDVVLLENGAASQRLVPSYEQGVLTIATEEFIPNGTLSLTLQVTCTDQVVYNYPLTAKVKNTAPAVTVKQLSKPNLFYTDSTAVLSLAVKNMWIADVELIQTEDFLLVEYEPETQEAILQFTESYILDHNKKPDTKAALLVYLEGYAQPVQKDITISTQNKRPNVAVTHKTSIVNIGAEERTAAFGFQLKDSQVLLPLHKDAVEVKAAFADAWVQDDQVVLTLHGEAGGTAEILLQLENWMEPVKLTHAVKVSKAAPALKFSNNTLNLSSIFTQQTDSAAATLDQSNLEIGGIRFVPAAASGTAARAESEKILLTYDPLAGTVLAETADPEEAPAPGTYSFTAYAAGLDGKELAGVKLKVKVNASAPTVKLKTATLALNKVLAGEETAATAVTVSDAERYTLVGFEYPDSENLPVELNCENGMLTAQLLDPDAADKTHTVKLTPVVLDEQTGEERALPKAVNVKVKVYSNAQIQVSLSAKGKLDAIDPDSEIRYTVGKITNACGGIDGVSLEGVDADCFDVCLNEDGTVSLKLLPGEEYAVKKTYKVQFRFVICGVEVLSKVISFKVSQSALALSAAPATAVFYQSQSIPMTVKLSLNNPAGAVLEEIALGEKTAAAFLAAMDGEAPEVKIAEDGRSAMVFFDVKDATKLASGKSYTVYLKVTAQGSAADTAATQLKMTVQVR